VAAPLFIHLPLLEIGLQVRELWRRNVVDLGPHFTHAPLVVVSKEVLPVEIGGALREANTARVRAVHGRELQMRGMG
jgi:hypothetical protein